MELFLVLGMLAVNPEFVRVVRWHFAVVFFFSCETRVHLRSAHQPKGKDHQSREATDT